MGEVNKSNIARAKRWHISLRKHPTQVCGLLVYFMIPKYLVELSLDEISVTDTCRYLTDDGLNSAEIILLINCKGRR